MPKRKTQTSSAVKNRWNRNHYDRITFTVAIGSAQIIQQLADEMGLSRAEYLRHLIIADAKSRGNGDISPIIGGGGVN